MISCNAFLSRFRVGSIRTLIYQTSCCGRMSSLSLVQTIFVWGGGNGFLARKTFFNLPLHSRISYFLGCQSSASNYKIWRVRKTLSKTSRQKSFEQASPPPSYATEYLPCVFLWTGRVGSANSFYTTRKCSRHVHVPNDRNVTARCRKSDQITFEIGFGRIDNYL